MESLLTLRRAPQRKQKLVVVSHTHWDREWYLPFQEFRIRLVRLVDLLLDIMARDPDFKHFTLDGQTIILGDYLEVRPEREEELRRLVQDGRILIGPWYVIPDEFLVGAEALIRNLLWGHRTGQRFGPVMKVGYLPDPFGHIAQLPQILRGFGIDSALLWRGVGSKVKKSEFVWRAPDGSQVLVIYTPLSYDNAAVLPSSIPQLMEAIKNLRQALTPYATTEYLLLMNGDDHLEPQANVPRLIAAANERLKDAELIHGTVPMLVEDVREAAEREGVTWQIVEGELRSAALAHLLAGVLSSRIDLKQLNAAAESLLTKWAEPFSVFAELAARRASERPIASRWGPLLNLAWRYLLQNHPHDSICGCSIDAVHQDMRARFRWSQEVAETITQQALEAITASINTTKIAPPAGYQAVGAQGLAPDANGEAGVSNLGYIVVFNPESGPRTGFVEVPVQLLAATPDLALADGDGNLLPYQVLGERQSELYSHTFVREQVQGYLRMAGIGGDWPVWKIRILEGIATRLLKGKIPNLALTAVDIRPSPGRRTMEIDVEMGAGKHNYEAIARALRQASSLIARGDVQFFRVRVVKRDEVDLGFVAPDVPGYGYRVFQLLAGHRHHPQARREVTSNVIENEFLAVQAEPETGSLTIVDKETGVVLEGINAFIDGGDAGDEYTYSPPAQDSIVDRPSEPAKVALVEDGPSRFTLRVQQTYLLPESLTEDRRSRSPKMVPCPITSYVSLYPGVRRIDIRTEVDNRAKDHRLRVLMSTDIQAEQSHAEGHFAVVSRAIEVPTPGADWVEHPVSSHPQKSFVDVNDGEVGLMIANKGLPEYDVSPGEQGSTIALTLIRAVGWLSRDDLATREGAAGPILPTPGAQMIGHHVFEYALLPHTGTWETVFHYAHWFANPMRAVRTGAHGGPLPPAASFVDVRPEAVVVSAVKPAEEGGGFVLRCFNITRTPVTARLATLIRLQRAERLNLNEESVEELPLQDDRTVTFPLGPNEIATIKLQP